MDSDRRKELTEVARGSRLPDRILHGGRVINLRSREIHNADILIYRDRIAAVLSTTSDRKSKAEWETLAPLVELVDVSGVFVSSGFIDRHVHIESPMSTVTEYAQAVVSSDTTTVADDPHEIGNVLGERGMRLLLDESRSTPLRMLLRVPGRFRHARRIGDFKCTSNGVRCATNVDMAGGSLPCWRYQPGVATGG